MTIYYDPKKIKIETINENGEKVDSGETLADHLATCGGCPFCD